MRIIDLFHPPSCLSTYPLSEKGILFPSNHFTDHYHGGI
jgi:hypothetical protein